MRAAAAIVMLLSAAGAASAQSPLAAEVRSLAARYHESPARIDALRPLVAQAAQAEPSVDNLLALAQIAFLYGDVRAHRSEDKLDAYEQGRPALELDPRFPPAYVLAGTVYYEVPGLVGGDLEKSERLFRRGLEVDGRFTGLRVGLARTLIKRGRVAEARRELQAVLDEKAPSNPADWTLKDSPEARRLLAELPARS